MRSFGLIKAGMVQVEGREGSKKIVKIFIRYAGKEIVFEYLPPFRV
jgi:hypothetical protein